MNTQFVGREPIAIVGLACRFPGGANTPSKLWDLVCQKRDVQTPIPPERFNSDNFYSTSNGKPGCTDAKFAYLLSEDVRAFDAAFFKTNPREAEAMDPQQRLLLETVYEAVEVAGIPYETLQGSDTAVYVGSMTGDYHEMLLRDPTDMPKYMATGTARSILSNRISYFFDWKGPSMTIDTACSSSLVAVHECVAALRSGVCKVACAAGANLILGPEMMISESKLRMLSPTGRSRMWDAAADGYARGEGTAAVILKTLSQALADGDHVYSIVRETGVNSDGRTNGITLPSADSQKALIRRTYANAGLDWTTDRCQFFEAHGTGTPAGDPIEARAIYEAFFEGDNQQNQGDMFVGSVKTVIGHLEGCAGLAGLIKAVEAVSRGVVPPNMLFQSLNPGIAPYAQRLHIPTEPVPWPKLQKAGEPRRASVNSFGFGGTNAHAIVESFDSAREEEDDDHRDMILTTPLVVSANSEKSLRAQVAALHGVLLEQQQHQLHNILFTLSQRRSQHRFRTFYSGHTREELLNKLSNDSNVTNVLQFRPNQGRILGVFTGQGAQWPAMGREILKASPVAQELMAKLEQALASLPEPPAWSLVEECLADPSVSRVAEAAISQPLCTAVQLMIVDLLRRAGVTFSCVIGHSSGEITAAYAAGFLSLQDAIRIAYYRGVCAKFAHGSEANNSPSGAMMAVGLSYDEAADFCDEHFAGRVDVAASNAPASVTLSGDKDAIGEAKALFDQRGTFARILRVDTAYHSHHMEPCAGPYMVHLKECNITPLGGDPSCTWFSSVLGERMDSSRHAEMLAGEYWKENMVSPVLFTVATELTCAGTLPCDVALEIGPHPALKGPFSQTFKQTANTLLPYQGTLTRNKHDVEALSDTLGFLWATLGRGVVDFTAYASAFSPSHAASSAVATSLPPYSWDHEKQLFWKESRRSLNFRQKRRLPHPLLGVLSPDSVAQDMRWHNVLRLTDSPWLRGHKVEGQVIYPAAAYLVMAIEAARAICEDKNVSVVELLDVDIQNAIQLSGGHEDDGDNEQGVETRFTLERRDIDNTEADSTTIFAEWACFTPSAGVETNSWKCNARGKLRVGFTSDIDGILPDRNFPSVSLARVDTERFYSSLADIGLQYTDAFKNLDSVERKSGLATGTAMRMQNPQGFPPAMMHPALLDSAFQLLFAAYCWPDDGSLHGPFVPTHFGSIRLVAGMDQAAPEEPLRVDAYLTDASSRELTADIDIFTEKQQQPLLQIQRLTCTSLLRAGPSHYKELYSRNVWEVDSASAIASLDDKEHEHDAPENLQLVDLCERLAYYYLRELNRAIDRQKVADMDWNFQRIFQWIDHLFPLIESGQHPTIQREWASDDGSWLLAQAAKFPEQVDLQLIHAVGRNLPAVVQKQTTMLEHMVKDDVLNRFYKQGLGFQRANGYLGRITRQLAHRYPRMKILEIGAGTGGATKSILEALGPHAFDTYTFTDISTGFFETAADAFAPWAGKMVFRPLDIEADIAQQGFEDGVYDFIVASNVLHATRSLEQTMRNVRRLLRPGGHLLLLEVTSDIVRVKLMMSGLPGWWLGGDDGRYYGPTITIPEWDSMLRATGFSGVDHAVNDFVDPSKYMTSVMLSQAVDHNVEVLRHPFSAGGSEENFLAGRSITIVGGQQGKAAISDKVSKVLRSACSVSVHQVESLRMISEQVQAPFGSTVILEDLDEPVFQRPSQEKLASLKRIFNDARQVLWVSRGCRSREPYASMSVGLCRGLAAEYPHVQLQHIDLEMGYPHSVDIPSAVAATMARLVFAASALGPQLHDIVWTIEPELILDQEGKWLIPRILPDEQLNQQLNAKRMTIYNNVDPKAEAVEVCRLQDRFLVAQPVPSLPGNGEEPLPVESIHIKVTHSLLLPLCLDDSACYSYLCHGYIVDDDSSAPVLAISPSNASSICVSPACVFSCPLYSGGRGTYDDASAAPRLLRNVAFVALAGQALGRVKAGATVILHEPDESLGTVVRWKAAQLGLKCIITTSSQPGKGDKSRWSAVFVHPHAPERWVKKVIPREAELLVDLSGSAFDEHHFPWRAYLPAECKVYTLRDFFGYKMPSDAATADSAAVFIREATSSSWMLKSLSDGPVISLSELSGGGLPAQSLHYSSVVGYDLNEDKRNIPIPVVVRPIQPSLLFNPHKTYLLVGCTGGLGQALCRWMVSSGARHLALTTRNADRVNKVWLQELVALGAVDVRLFQVDISDRAALIGVRDRISREMAPIYGVANAAMVLSDRSFGELNVEDFTTVFGPKVKGTQNLHDLFQDADKVPLSFFVMFSSLASIVGNRGQSNYVAANMFMSAVAEQRRAMGLAASVIHIGMVLGVGYVSSTGTYESTLRQYNYMPIAEPDFLDMFSQAILVGQPRSVHPPELITGLNRHSLRTGAQKPFWHENLRFCHHTLRDEPQKESQSGPKVSVMQRIAEAEGDADEVLAIVSQEFCTKLERMLQAASGSIQSSQSLVNLGVDSLIAVEIRSWFVRELDVDVPVLKVLNAGSIHDLCCEAVARLPLRAENSNSNNNNNNNNTTTESKEVQADIQETKLSTSLSSLTSSSPSSSQVCEPFPTPSLTQPAVQLLTTSTSSTDEYPSTAPSLYGLSSRPSCTISHSSDFGANDIDIDNGNCTTESQSVQPLQMAKTLRSGQLSFAQERMWFLLQYLQDPTTYNVTVSYRITGPLRIDALQDAFCSVIRRHESLRTRFYLDHPTGRPMQAVLAEDAISFQLGVVRDSEDASLDKEFDKMKKTRFDLENGDIMRAVVLWSPGRDEHLLVVGFHHIAFDGFSGSILVRDLGEAYSGRALEPLRTQYLDYALEERASSFKYTNIPAETLQFWKSQFTTLPAALPLFDFAECKTRVPLVDYRTQAVQQNLPATLSNQIRSTARGLGATPFHIHLSALQALLYHLLSVRDLCIGVVDANKAHAAHIDTIGFFVNLLPLRFRVDDGAQTLASLVHKTKATADRALQHSAMPFDILLDELKVPRSTLHNPLFQVVLNFKMGSTQTVALGPAVRAEQLCFSDADNPYDLSIDVENYPDRSTQLTMKTQRHLYTAQELQFAMDFYVRMLECFSMDPAADQNLTLQSLAQPSKAEVGRALQIGKGERIPPPRMPTIAHYFEDAAVSRPDATAVITDGGPEERRVSYSLLNILVDDLASRLLCDDRQSGQRVCVYCEPSVWTITSLLAISKIGGTYIPLDQQYPVKRLQLIIDDCEPDVILIDESTSESASLLQTNARRLLVDSNTEPRQDVHHPPIANLAKGSDTACIYYTSGTTGVPKGVMLTHANVVHFADAMVRFHHISSGGVYLQNAPIGFDLSLCQMALPILTGSTLLVVSSKNRKDPTQLARLMLSHAVTHTIMTPTLAASLCRYGSEFLSRCSQWRFALMSGEPLRAHVVTAFRRLGLDGLKLVNGYGPTEITVNSTAGTDNLVGAAAELPDTREPSIGRTLPNYSSYILDEEMMRPVGVGRAGELCVGGAGVAMGYLNRDELTQSRFVDDPFATKEDRAKGWTRMYRTGDRAKFLPDGRIVLLGRIAGDSQVKLRGFRIELDDIANTIVRTSGQVISEAAVSLRRSVDGDNDGSFLVAFVMLSPGPWQGDGTATVASFLRQLLKQLPLPQYMIPAKLVPVDQLPVGPTGKLDRNALDRLSIPHDADDVDSHEENGLTITQTKLKEMWLETLPLEVGDMIVSIGADTDFFEAGGNSLRIVMLRERIKRGLGVSVSVFDLFQAGTLARMAAKIDDSGAELHTRSAIDWEVETRVGDDDLPIGSEKPVCYRSTAEGDDQSFEVILTGATGFLGLSILECLLDDKRVSKVHCLAIRQASSRVLSERQHRLLNSPGVVRYNGDLTSPLLGLSDFEFTSLSQRAHAIIHNGADVSFLKTYQSLRAANVTSTRELARLALPRGIPLHFVSSSGVAKFVPSAESGLLETSIAASTPPTDGSAGYAASKWAAEVYLENWALKTGHPVWIHRPSNITGPGVPAADLMQSILRYSVQMRALPDVSGWRGFFDFVPVEKVAGGIAGAIHEGTQQMVSYRHHCGARKIAVRELRSHLEIKYGIEMESVDMEEWIARAEEAGLDGVVCALARKYLEDRHSTVVPSLLRSG